MITRRSVWSDARVTELLQSFVPAADEVWRLQHEEGAECDLFRKIAEQGHYAGRTEPTDTRQGIYATAPSGELLASINTRQAEDMISMLQTALERWEQLPPERRFLDADPLDDAPLNLRTEKWYPVDGLVLSVYSRDLPRDRPSEREAATRRRRSSWKEEAWNQDRAWFRKQEALALIPDDLEVGATRSVEDSLIRRLARLHLVDNVRGQVTAFAQQDVESAELTSTVTAVHGSSVELELRGATRAVDLAEQRGVECTLLGHARFDRTEQRFLDFQLVALGTRWGSTRFNGREHDTEPGPIGFVFSLAPDEAKVAPAFVWMYGWD